MAQLGTGICMTTELKDISNPTASLVQEAVEYCTTNNLVDFKTDRSRKMVVVSTAEEHPDGLRTVILERVVPVDVDQDAMQRAMAALHMEPSVQSITGHGKRKPGITTIMD